jgi:hypothetical protein
VDNVDKARVWNDTTYARLKKGSHFDLNIHLVLGMQHMGCGERDAAILAGMLDLAIPPMETAWSQIEQEIGINEIKLGSKLLKAMPNWKQKSLLLSHSPTVSMGHQFQ